MMRILPFLMISVALTGCVNAHKIRVDQGTLIEPETLKYMQTGLTQDQVRKLIGPPANVSSFNNQRWEYFFKSSDEKFQADKVKQLIILFDARGYVSSWTKKD